jgi:hypothetical protein
MPAGYSGTALAKKLGLKDGAVLALLDAPTTWTVPDPPPGVEIRRAGAAAGALTGIDIAIAFCSSAADVEALVPVVESLAASASVWVAWPRKAGGHVSDVGDNLLREVLLPVGIVDVKVAALDDDWSGLKFMWRIENRAGR